EDAARGFRQLGARPVPGDQRDAMGHEPGGLYRGSIPARPDTFRRMTDFKPGLGGVVAVETEIAEPDREGGSLRYRGVDIEDLVGHYPYENVWGLLVDND